MMAAWRRVCISVCMLWSERVQPLWEPVYELSEDGFITEAQRSGSAGHMCQRDIAGQWARF